MQLQSILYETSECSKSVIQFQIKKNRHISLITQSELLQIKTHTFS